MGILEKLETATSMLCMCLGNTCRSPAMEGFAKKFARDYFNPTQFETIRIASAGLNDYFSHAQPYSVKFVMELEGESIANHVPRKITRKLAENFDLIIIMEEYMRDKILNLFPRVEGLAGKIFLLKDACEKELHPGSLEIQDPYRSDERSYFKVIKEIQQYTKCLVKKWASRYKKGL